MSPRGPSQADCMAGNRRFPRWRKWLARLLAVVIAPLLFLTFSELTLRLFGYGYDTSYFIEAGDGEGYLSNPKFGWQFFGPELSRTPIQMVVSASKPENTYRVFVFGGSAAQGFPDPAFSFGRILEAMLNDRYPPTRFEVINTAMVAVNSHVVLPIVKECGGFDGDLYVVYMGNNEVVGPHGAGTIFRRPCTSLRIIRSSIFVRSTRLGQLIGNTIRTIVGKDANSRKEWGGMKMFLDHKVAATDPRLKTVYDNFRANLNDICQQACKAGAKIIVSTVLTNLADCPPFNSMHRSGLSAAEKLRWEEAYEQGRAFQESGDYERAIQQYAVAEKIDDQFAELYFRLGKCSLALKKFAGARRHLVRGRDLDTLRFRADTNINKIIREVAGNREAEGVYLVDAENSGWIRTFAPDGIAGAELFHEHVHPNFEGNYVLAATMFEKISRLLPPKIAKNTQSPPRPPSLKRCAELTLFTAYNRFFAAYRIAALTLEPPFSKQQGKSNMARTKVLESRLTPTTLDRITRDYRRVLSLRPDDLLLRNCFASLQMYRREPGCAAEQYRALLERYPWSGVWQHDLAVALADQGETAEAITILRTLLNEEPYNLHARTSFASILRRAGEPDQAIEEYQKVLSIQPEKFRAHFELGQIFLDRGEPEQAERHFATAVELRPEIARFHFALGRALREQGKWKDAADEYRQALSIQPNDARTHAELGRVLLLDEPPQFDQAIDSLRRAVRIDANLKSALADLAWLHATNPNAAFRDGQQAVLLAERASELANGTDPKLLDVLAAAYAETGKFGKAVKTAQNAVALAEQAAEHELVGRIRTRLDLYLAGKPYREPSP